MTSSCMWGAQGNLVCSGQKTPDQYTEIIEHYDDAILYNCQTCTNCSSSNSIKSCKSCSDCVQNSPSMPTTCAPNFDPCGGFPCGTTVQLVGTSLVGVVCRQIASSSRMVFVCFPGMTSETIVAALNASKQPMSTPNDGGGQGCLSIQACNDMYSKNCNGSNGMWLHCSQLQPGGRS